MQPARSSAPPSQTSRGTSPLEARQGSRAPGAGSRYGNRGAQVSTCLACQNRRIAVYHPAKIVPGKLKLLQTCVPQQPWTGRADTTTLTRLGSYRFDDPAGQIGLETHLLGTAEGQSFKWPWCIAESHARPRRPR